MIPCMPTTLLQWTTVLMAAAILLIMLWSAVVSYRERERRAARRLLGLSAWLPLPYALAGFLQFPGHTIIAVLLIATPLIGAMIMLIPGDRRRTQTDDSPTMRVDERDTIFARYYLQPGTKRFAEYYRLHPRKASVDARFRAKPGLLAPGALYYQPSLFAAATAGFTAVTAFHALCDDRPAQRRIDSDAAQMTAFIKNWGIKLGAVMVGITGLRDHHLYSHIGRSEPYGAPITRNHSHAIAFAVEMDRFMLDHAPLGPTVMESAQQYLRAGGVAVQIACFIRNLGYAARAHIDGNYRVICPLVARDAGLGEISRIGLLMTPHLGPRVRLAVVTTDLPLVCDVRTPDDAMIDFCRHCRKCAEVCPSRAIPFGDRQAEDGALRWKIDAEACFAYWCEAGSDCGRCVRVCPYSHPDNRLHNAVRYAVARSALFRRAAIKMDDWLYGRKPSPLPLPEWMQVRRQKQHRP